MAEPQARTVAQPPSTTEWGLGARKAAKFVTAAGIGAALLAMAGLTLTATMVTLVVATPALVIFGPVLVSTTAVLALAGAGVLASGVFGVAAVSVLAWIYNYVAGKRPLGSDQLDSARAALASKAREVKEKARDYVLDL